MAVLTQVPPTKEKKPYSFDDALTMTGYGAFNAYLFIACGGFLMCVIVETMSMMFVVPAAQCDLNLTLGEKGLLSSISFFGVVTSSFMWGYIADTKGRKNVLVMSLLTSSIASFISSMLLSSELFIALRFINGFCIGGASSVVYAYIGEFHNNTLRPKIVSWVAAFVALANMYLPALAWLILPLEFSYDIPVFGIQFRSWRLLVLIYAFPSLIFSTLLFFCPESPKFLATNGKLDEVLNTFQSMYSINKLKSRDTFPVSEILWEDLGNEKKAKPKGFFQTLKKQVSPLFGRKLLPKTIMVSTLQFGIFCSSSGVLMWYPEMLNDMSAYLSLGKEDVTLCKSIDFDEPLNTTMEHICTDNVDTEVFLVSLVVGAVYLGCYIFIGFVINLFGKKTLTIGFIVVTSLAGMAVHFVEGYTVIQILLGIYCLSGAEVGIVNAIVVDLYPTQVRAMAMAVSLMFGRFGAMAGTNIVGPLLYNLCDYMFYVFAIDAAILIVVLLLLPSANKLEKIEEDPDSNTEAA